jgi:uncharacterized membrane protein YphA (DoxX/SURF4 family)
VQRLYSTFPGRWPGAGLLLLRAAVGVWAAIEGGSHVLAAGGASASGEPALIIAGGALAVVSGAALVIGFLTPIGALVIALMGSGRALSWIPAPDPYLIGTHAGAWFVTIVAVGVALLGPGAFSLDSHLFGRREIIIPPSPDTSPGRGVRQSIGDSTH